MNLSTNQSGNTTMSEPPIRKFMFDRSFDGASGTTARPVERKPVTLKPEQFDALTKENWDAGYAAGLKVIADADSQKSVAMILQLEKRLTALAENIATEHARRESEVRMAVLSIAKKLLPAFTNQYGVGEIDALLGETISQMLREPRLVVRVNEGEFDMLNDRIAEITSQKAYAGRVIVLADEGIAAGDCLIEWADGGVERKTAETWRDIDKAVAPDQSATETPGE